jgi:hypothetical protein
MALLHVGSISSMRVLMSQAIVLVSSSPDVVQWNPIDASWTGTCSLVVSGNMEAIMILKMLHLNCISRLYGVLSDRGFSSCRSQPTSVLWLESWSTPIPGLTLWEGVWKERKGIHRVHCCLTTLSNTYVYRCVAVVVFLFFLENELQ